MQSYHKIVNKIVKSAEFWNKPVLVLLLISHVLVKPWTLISSIKWEYEEYLPLVLGQELNELKHIKCPAQAWQVLIVQRMLTLVSILFIVTVESGCTSLLDWIEGGHLSKGKGRKENILLNKTPRVKAHADKEACMPTRAHTLFNSGFPGLAKCLVLGAW